MKRFNHKKLNEGEDKEKSRVEVSKRFAASDDLDAAVETIRENTKFKLKRVKP
jgi:hypothetical protein